MRSERGEWSRPASGRAVSEPDLVTSLRQAAALCNVTPPVVRRWLSLGLLPEPPWHCSSCTRSAMRPTRGQLCAAGSGDQTHRCCRWQPLEAREPDDGHERVDREAPRQEEQDKPHPARPEAR